MAVMVVLAWLFVALRIGHAWIHTGSNVLRLRFYWFLAGALVLLGLDPVTAISGAATSLSNVGPGLGPVIGPAGNFSSLPDPAIWVLTLLMLVGRLELLAVYVLFSTAFWRA